MGVTIATAQAAANTSIGNQDFTTANLGGLTPVAAVFNVTYAITNNVAVADNGFCWGVATATDERGCFFISDEDAQGTTDAHREVDLTHCILLNFVGGGSADGTADFVSFITNGVRINWDNAPAAAYLVTVTLIAGTDVSAKVVNFLADATSGNTVNVTSVGFEADVLLPGTARTNSSNSDAQYSIGVVANDGSDTQRSLAFRSKNGQVTSELGSELTELYGLSGLNGTMTALQWGLEFGGFDASGFDATTRVGNAANQRIIVLALAFGGAVNFWVDTVDAPAANGNDVQTGPQFTPQFVMLGTTILTAVETAQENGSLGISVFDANSEFSTNTASQDNQPTSNTQSLVDNTAVRVTFSGGGAALTAAFVSFDTLGWTYNFSDTTGGVRKFWALAIEEVSVVPAAVVTIAIPPIFSQTSSRSLSIQVSDPLWKSNFLFTLTGMENRYSQTIEAIGGYNNAQFNVKDSQTDIEDWIDNGLGRHIETYDEAQNKIWDGFVNRISANLGSLTVTRGPMLDIANRVSIVFSTIITTVTPPLFGIRVQTALANDVSSQTDFGIIEKILSSGGVRPTEAEQIRDTFLAENKEPQTSQNINIPPSQEISVTIECLGYIHLTKVFPFNSTQTGLQNLSTRIGQIFDASPTVTFDTSGIASNTTQVRAFENDNNIAWGLLKGLTAKGDASDNRFNLGVFTDQRVKYEQVVNEIVYQERLSDPESRIETLSGERVFPWNVLPGRWLFIPDFLIGQSQPTDLRLDPRAVFIESVTFTAPWGLRIVGGKADRLPQRLARLGLSGIGA